MKVNLTQGNMVLLLTPERSAKEVRTKCEIVGGGTQNHIFQKMPSFQRSQFGVPIFNGFVRFFWASFEEKYVFRKLSLTLC